MSRFALARRSIIVLIVANFIPLWGLLFRGWEERAAISFSTSRNIATPDGFPKGPEEHTSQAPADVAGELAWDQDRHMWRGSLRQALRDMRATRRSLELVNLEVADELV